jgi:enoyl-CoA hydratase/carnithine racemase
MQSAGAKSAGRFSFEGTDMAPCLKHAEFHGRIGTARKVNFEAVVDALEEARPVTVAVLHGSVYGGGTDLALACDFRLGAQGIDMFMPAARLGLHFYQVFGLKCAASMRWQLSPADPMT